MALVSTLYLYALCVLACCVRMYLKYVCVKATVHSKTYFGMEKDACVPTRPMNGVCMGLVYTYKSKEHTGYAQVSHDKHKIGDKVDICVEKADPDMFTTEMKRDLLQLTFWLLLAILLGALTAVKLTVLSGKPELCCHLHAAVGGFGLVFFATALWMKK